MDFGSSVNFLQLNFILLSLCMAVFGFLINYGDRYLPATLTQIFRYGRANMSKAKPTFVKAIEVPKSWFGHFYLFSSIFQTLIVYFVVCIYLYHQTEESSGSLLLKKTLLFTGGDSRQTTVSVSTTLLVVSLFWIQVTRRLYETVFVSVFSDTKMNILHYVVAFLHYSGSMLSIIAHSPLFSTDPRPQENATRTGINIFQWLAVLLFFYGSLEQYKAHLGYANLRKSKDKVVTYGHKIPAGGLFELVSCPNYFAEIIIYSSISCVFEFQNSTWNYVTLWVIVNQITSGIMNHKWYLEKFPEYPKKRKAIIPYLC